MWYMRKIADDSHNSDNIYTKEHVKSLLSEYYGDHIFFANVSGKKSVVCFRHMAQKVINDTWYANRSSDLGQESLRSLRRGSCKVDQGKYS